MEIVNYLTPVNVITYLLLFIRIASFLSFLPFFNYQTIPMSIKSAFAFWLSILIFPFAPKITFDITFLNLIIAILNEVAFAFFVGAALNLIFDILRFVGEQISFVMGFTMASIMDPNSGVQSTIVSQFIVWIAILTFFTFNGDHLEILFLIKTISSLPFGAFFNYDNVYEYFLTYMYKYFLLGITLAFPIIAISLFSDIIFGMIMKTMPQFNLLVVGFPIKITAVFAVLIVILASMMKIFSIEFIRAINSILSFIY